MLVYNSAEPGMS